MTSATYDFTTEEASFLVNILMNPDQAAPLYAGVQKQAIADKIRLSAESVLTAQDVGLIQYVLQEQNEVWGRVSSTANEKNRDIPFRFRAHETLKLVKSITDKLGAKMVVDLESHSDQRQPRDEGSRNIMSNQSPGM